MTGDEGIRTEGNYGPGQSFEKCNTHIVSGHLETGCCAPDFPIATDIRSVLRALLAPFQIEEGGRVYVGPKGGGREFNGLKVYMKASGFFCVCASCEKIPPQQRRPKSKDIKISPRSSIAYDRTDNLYAYVC